MGVVWTISSFNNHLLSVDDRFKCWMDIDTFMVLRWWFATAAAADDEYDESPPRTKHPEELFIDMQWGINWSQPTKNPRLAFAVSTTN